ncbi:MAG: hypothetical protein IPM57_05885 [Oligoflexia bacterium]|nr:hypothetical protein [Oligoflexia bacterium]
MLLVCACAMADKTTASSNRASYSSLIDSPEGGRGYIDLDDKSTQRIYDGFRAVISNDDKKAKLAYGRTYKHMPNFLQFAYDLRFRNFERAKEVAERLSYTDFEKTFWKTLVEKKPAVISKYVCDWFKENKFGFEKIKPIPKEADWFKEYTYTLESMQKELRSKSPLKKTELDATFEKYNFLDGKKNPIALSADSQKELLATEFFDKFRNMQRRDTNYYSANFWSAFKVASYGPYFGPNNAWDFYLSLEVTDHPRKSHFLRRLKGIIKDMRENMVMHRLIGSKIIQDEEDYNKALAIAYFINRYPFVSAFLRFDFTLNNCGYSPKQE